MKIRYYTEDDRHGTGFAIHAESRGYAVGEASMDDDPNPLVCLERIHPALCAQAVAHGATVNTLHELSVRVDCQQRGVGTELMRRFVNHADERGIGLLVLSCWPPEGNTGDAIAKLKQFYARFGFVDTGAKDDGAPLLARKSPVAWPDRPLKKR